MEPTQSLTLQPVYNHVFGLWRSSRREPTQARENMENMQTTHRQASAGGTDPCRSSFTVYLYLFSNTET